VMKVTKKPLPRNDDIIGAKNILNL